jgi:hypothetical protein
MELLTVKELIDALQDEDPTAVVAIENNGYPHTTTLLTTEGYFQPDVYMKRTPRIQNEYLLADEIDDFGNMTKVVILCSTISQQEVLKSGITLVQDDE